MEKGREGNNTWVSRVWQALKRDLSAGFAKNPLVVGWNLLMCVRKHLHHPGGGEWLPRAGAERGTRCSCRIPRPGISPRIPTRFPFFQRSQSIGAPCQEGPLGWGMSLQQPQHHVLVGKGAFFGPGSKKGERRELSKLSGPCPCLRFCFVPAASRGIRVLRGCFEGSASPWV